MAFHSYVSLPDGKTPGKWNFLTCWISLWGSGASDQVGCERFGGRWSHRQRIWQGCLESIPRDAAVLYRLDNLVLVYYLYLFFPCSWWVLARYVWIRWSGHDELGISPRSISIHIWVQFDFIGCYMAMIIGLCLFQLRSGMQWYQHNYYYIYDSMLLICS